MDKLSEEYADRVHFLFVYVREVHPDDYPSHPVHRTIEQKFQHARDLQARHDTPRRILVDTLDGDVHRTYGGIPNMSWIIDHTGRIAYKAGWTIESDLRSALENVAMVRELKREATQKGVNFRAYYKEEITALTSFRVADPEYTRKVMEGL
ncbi:MAG: hypothetical protein IIC21_06825 [Chloroflexi bacterium]|nr:hypothetical protein [Chloroflexota bacterium]